MARQIIEIPSNIFNILGACRGQIALLFGQAGFDSFVQENAPAAPTLAIFGLPDLPFPGPRPLNRDWILIAALVPEGATPTCWPRPLPDAITLDAIDKIAPVLTEFEGFTAHQCLAMADAFDRARQAPAIDRRPVSPLRPRSRRQRRWRCVGAELSSQFREPLAAFDRQLESYQARLLETDLEPVIAGLSSWGELGMKLRLRPRNEDGEASVALLAESRRGDLRDAMEDAASLADATIGSLTTFDPHVSEYRHRIRTRDLAWLNAWILGNPFRPSQQKNWRSDHSQTAENSTLAYHSLVPPIGILRELDHWSEDMDAGHWVGIHPLVHAAVAHLELLRIRPFVRGNGRLARLVMQILLRRVGAPVLPWELAFELLYHKYQHAARHGCRKDGLPAFMQASLHAGQLAIRLATRVIDELTPVRDMLATGFPSLEHVPLGPICQAEGLLRSPLVEGLTRVAGKRPNKDLVLGLAARSEVDRVWTPIGATYSVPAVRKFFARLVAEAIVVPDPDKE